MPVDELADQRDNLLQSIQASSTPEEIQNTLKSFLETFKNNGEMSDPIPVDICHEIADKLFRDFEVTGLIMVPFECARFFELAGVRLLGDTRWKAMVDSEAEGLRSETQKSDDWLNRLLGQVSLTGMVQGIDQGLVRLLSLFKEYPGVIPQISNDIGHLLAEAGWFDARLPKTRKQIAKTVNQTLRKGEDFNDIPGIFSAMGFNKLSPPQWLEFLFSNVLLKTINEAGKMGQFDLALRLELMTYLGYLGKYETRDHYHKVTSRLLPAMRKVGHAHLRQMEKLETKIENLSDLPVVAFYLHSSDILGHTEVFLTLLRAITNSTKQRFRPLIYVGGGGNVELTDRLKDLDVPYVLVSELSGKNAPMTRHWQAVRNDCVARDVKILGLS